MSAHVKRRRRRRKEKKLARDKCLGPKGRKAYQSLHLLSVETGRHHWLLCQGEICATVTAGRGPLSDWSAQVQVCGGRDERQLLVTRVSWTCDGGRLFWATLARIRGVRHR